MKKATKTVPMSPEGLRGDLSAQFDPIPSSVAEGDEVLIGINIQSTFDTELANVPFKWEITKKNGEPLSATFAGHAAVGEGNIDKIPEKGERMLYAYFKMPDSDVNIKFEINKDGKTPTEVLLDNNVLDSGDSIKVVSELPPTVGQFDLDYNVLSRKVDYPLASADIEAQLILPKGSWNGNARGELEVTNKTSDLFRSFNVTNNPAVNEDSSRIVRKPQIHTTLQRSDFGDNPKNGNYLDWSTPWEPKTRSGSVNFSGSVRRPYKYIYYCSDEDCEGHTGYNSTSAAFNSGTNTRTIRTFIYNGKQLVTPKTFENKIDYNTIYYLQKNLFWTSEPYKLNVVRWMCHQAEDDSLYGWTTVPGKYQRTFTQQNSAEIKWVAANTMEKAYQRSRDAASNRDYRKSEYDKAVFASDIDFKNVDYPIKSGYYFNPAGTYTFDVETVTYKTTKADTKDHKDLVDAAIKSFRYESDLMYINSYKEPVNIQNELLPKSGNSYGRRTASLTAQDPTGVDDAVLLNILDRADSESRYSKKVEELQYSEESGGYTHEYFKEILEGYDESGTIGSRNNFKYREYIKAGQHMYKITEKTTVTIEINPANRKVYTHVQMADGKYTVKAWIDDIALSGMSNEYKKLGTIKGISAIDKIEVSVKGSMFEDTN